MAVYAEDRLQRLQLHVVGPFKALGMICVAEFSWLLGRFFCLPKLTRSCSMVF